MDTYGQLLYINAVHRENHRDAYVNHMLHINDDPRIISITAAVGRVLLLKLAKLAVGAGEAIRPIPVGGAGNGLGSDVEVSGTAAVGTNPE